MQIQVPFSPDPMFYTSALGWVKNWGLSSLQNRTSKQPGEGDPQSHALVLLDVISMQPVLFKSAQVSVCQ